MKDLQELFEHTEIRGDCSNIMYDEFTGAVTCYQINGRNLLDQPCKDNCEYYRMRRICFENRECWEENQFKDTGGW